MTTSMLVHWAHQIVGGVDKAILDPFLARFHLSETCIPDQGMRKALRHVPRYQAVEDVIPTAVNEWALAPEKARLLAHLVINMGARSILEFGAGQSSLVLARALSVAGGGRLTSIEQMPEWCAEPWAKASATPQLDARMIVSVPECRFTWAGCYFTYRSAAPAIARRGPFDLMLVDAPPGSFGRDGALHIAHQHLRPGALVVLDDAGRTRERWTLYRWLRTYPGLELAVFAPDFGNTGIAVLLYHGDRRARWSAGAVASSIANVLRHWSGRAARGVFDG